MRHMSHVHTIWCNNENPRIHVTTEVHDMRIGHMQIILVVSTCFALCATVLGTGAPHDVTYAHLPVASVTLAADLHAKL